jgi:pimeloyl-ACP methyl ester carboxylesterase
MGKSIQSRRPPQNLQNRSFRRTIEFGKHRTAGSGYMSYSDRVGPSVILLHEFFGLQQSFKSYADLLNDQGFTVLAPDLYDGAIAESVESAQAMARSLDIERTVGRIKAAAQHLADNWHPRLGVVGFSLGADFAVELAQDFPVEAAVLCYGLGEMALSTAWPLRGPRRVDLLLRGRGGFRGVAGKRGGDRDAPVSRYGPLVRERRRSFGLQPGGCRARFPANCGFLPVPPVLMQLRTLGSAARRPPEFG